MGRRWTDEKAAARSKAFRRKYGSVGRAKAIAAEPCARCKVRGRSVNAHCPEKGDPSKGVGRKASWQTVVPLCDACHRLRDEVCGSNNAFFLETGLDLKMASAWFAKNFHPDRFPDDELAE